MTDGKDCLFGHNCNQLETVYPRMCKYGEYADNTNNGQCEPCPTDQYCGANELEAGVDCPNGYFCDTNCTIEFPNWLESEESRYYLCPLGQFCDNAETSTKNDCPEGTYMPRYGAEDLASCVQCPAGYYCPTAGMSIPLLCPTGQHCPEGSGDPLGSLATKPTDCTDGAYCPEFVRTKSIGTPSDDYPNKQGPAEALACEYGTFSTGTGNTDCTVCTAGMLCPGLST